MKSFNVGNKKVGENEKVFIIAEIGANHNGDFDLAKKSIEEAYKCGVDAVKFQTYTAKELLADTDRIITWGKKGDEKQEKISEMFDRISLKREWHKELFNYAKSLGLEVFSTPFSVDGVEFLENLNVPCYKVASSDVNYVDMLEVMAKKEKPIILSVGKSTLREVDSAVDLLEINNCKELIIMHCVAQYPSPMDEMNLNVIKSLKLMYPDSIIGFSDHSIGTTSAIGAVVLGAKVVEKHFTIDKTLEGPDHWFSLDPKEMTQLVSEIRNIEIALGSSRKRVLECEKDERKKSIRSLVLKKDIKKGEIITENHLAMLRPGYGISPFDKHKVIGLKVAQDFPKNTVLKWEYLK